jgi:hypothetical protein
MSPDLEPSGYVAEGLAERIYDEFVCMEEDLLQILELQGDVVKHLTVLRSFIEQDLT